MTQLILCMIVKNEAHVIERCLTHALPAIDAACICDTGSSDGTPELIERTLDGKSIPFRVCRHEWINFGANRSRSFAETRSFAQELGWDLSHSYALFLDADLILRMGEDFDAAQLTAGGYSLQWRHGVLVYSNIGLARLDLDWHCTGAAHEFWSAEGAGAIDILPTLWVDHIADGGVASEKADRNVRLLEAELEEQPDNPRTQLYLAQTYFDMGRFEDARRLYLRRIATGGWEEETWFATYRAAICSANLDDWPRAVGELLGSWERRPQRAEPLYMLAHFARLRRQWHTAMMAAERALTVPFPKDDRLFIDRRAYREGPIEEISIVAYYAGQDARGTAACDALLHHRASSSRLKNLASRNSAYYARPLATPDRLKRVSIPIELWGMNFSPSTGSICRANDGYALVTRLVNYYQEAGATFMPRDTAGKYRTRNVWVEFDRDLNQIEARLIDDGLVEQLALVQSSASQVCGVEDCRLFRWRNAWWFMANSRQFHERQLWRVVVGRLSRDGTSVEEIVPLQYPASQAVEKNWVPLIHDDRLLIVYSRDPLVVLEPDLKTGECREVQRILPPVDLSRTRGSSAMIAVGDRYLGIIHEVAFLGQARNYLHRFVEMDRDLRITRASRLVTFLHRGVEYTCGMCLSHDGEDLVVSFSWEERESWLVTLPRSEVEAMLLPIEELAFLDPPQAAETLGPGWLDLLNPEGVKLIGPDEPFNGPVRLNGRSRQRRRRLWAPRRRRGSGPG